MPQYSFNGIGDLLIGQGYQIKTNVISGFNNCGTYAIPNQNIIQLYSGWNMIGYLRIERIYWHYFKWNKLRNPIAKNYMGAVYMPEFNFNGIGFMMRGQGYQIKILNHDTLEY